MQKNLFFNDATPSAIIYAPNRKQRNCGPDKTILVAENGGFTIHAKEPMVLTG